MANDDDDQRRQALDAAEAKRLRLAAERQAQEEAARRELAEQHRTATLAALHAQVVSVLNVKALVPIVLDLATSNYGSRSFAPA